MHSNVHLPSRILATLLAVVLLLGTVTIAASAATMDTVQHYDTYTCLGDSVAEGFGPDNQDYVGLKRVDFAYHALVADAVTADTFYPMARPGGSTSEVLYFVDKTIAYDASFFRIPIAEEDAEALRVRIQDAIAESDLITLNVGSNDLFTTSLFAVAAVLYGDTEIPEDVQKMIDNYGTFGQAFQDLFLRAQKLNKLPEAIRTFNETLTKAYNTFRTNWNLICKNIYEINPDVTLVAVGFFNPVKSLRLTGDSLIEIGQAMDSIARMMNRFVRSQADYAKQYLYADVYNTECYKLLPVDDENFAATMVPNVHPTHEGHAYMAQQIVKVLPEREAEPTPTTEPTTEPTTQPTTEPTTQPTTEPTVQPTVEPTVQPTTEPTVQPTVEPTVQPTVEPTVQPTVEPTTQPTAKPCDGGKDCPSKAFTDVDRSEKSWSHLAIDWAVQNNITNGTSPTTFSPAADCTRAQMVTFLWRAKGCPEVKTEKMPFTDVAKDQYYCKAVLWAVENKITNGTSETTFSPDATVTRAQTVTFLWRLEGTPKATAANPFADVPAGEFYTDAVLWAVEQNITNGRDATHFAPDGFCTRAEIVTFLHRDLVK